MSAAGASTRSAISACVVASVISSPIARCTRSCSGRRQAMRNTVGGASPSQNAIALTKPSKPWASATGESGSLFAAARMIASGDRHRRDHEHPHPPARDARLPAAGADQPEGARDREDRPVDDEDDEVGVERRRARLARLRDVRERERPDRERDGHHAHAGEQPPRGRPEGVREPEQEVREDDEQDDQEAQQRTLEEAVRMLRDDAREQHDGTEHAEGRRRPAGRRVAAREPAPAARSPRARRTRPGSGTRLRGLSRSFPPLPGE